MLYGREDDTRPLSVSGASTFGKPPERKVVRFRSSRGESHISWTKSTAQATRKIRSGAI
jgi:hypothetical protein